ncbi:hypothetical protein Pmani_019017 [Petrolisthes manimaculis]|uniref:Uncharacterized protein n=1 Tax=Petrolisthes manimaculis TaxID=1843537 RepID=A0AAE1PLJ6_9EUCA|nr:hypothetical protein Pmani_019017 [Petrolisthes manimaculis]
MVKIKDGEIIGVKSGRWKGMIGEMVREERIRRNIQEKRDGGGGQSVEVERNGREYRDTPAGPEKGVTRLVVTGAAQEVNPTWPLQVVVVASGLL